jgi:hypothetical protein
MWAPSYTIKTPIFLCYHHTYAYRATYHNRYRSLENLQHTAVTMTFSIVHVPSMTANSQKKYELDFPNCQKSWMWSSRITPIRWISENFALRTNIQQRSRRLGQSGLLHAFTSFSGSLSLGTCSDTNHSRLRVQQGRRCPMIGDNARPDSAGRGWNKFFSYHASW